MHYSPVGPPPSGRRRTVTRLVRRRRRPLAVRLLFAAAVLLGVTALVLAVPVVAFRADGTAAVSLESSSSTPRAADGSSPVVMGLDGGPVRTSATAGASARGTTAPPVTAAPDTTTSRAGSSSAASSSPASSSAASSSALSSSAALSAAPGTEAATSPGRPTGTSSVPASDSAGSSSSSSSVSAAGGSGGSASPSATGTPPSPPAADPADELVSLVNAERARSGCDALVPDRELASAAGEHSAAMRDEDFFGLTDPDDGSVLDHGARAATIARGSSDPADVLAGWLADPTDRASLLDCSLGTVGVGRAAGDGGPWWTALFG